jgi:hypothetical protein
MSSSEETIEMVQLFAVETASETSNQFILNDHFYNHKSN